MKRFVLFAAAAAVVFGAALGIHLWRENVRDARFTAEIRDLQQAGPEVTLPDAMTPDDVREKVSAIADIYETHNQAWCEADGHAYASVFTDDVDFIAFDGSRTKGRAEIAASHQELFDRFLPNTCLEGAITNVKFVADGAAVVHVVSGTRFDDGPIVRRPSIQTYVAVEDGNEWRFASFHNGRIDPVDDWNFVRLGWFGLKTFVFRR